MFTLEELLKKLPPSKPVKIGSSPGWKFIGTAAEALKDAKIRAFFLGREVEQKYNSIERLDGLCIVCEDLGDTHGKFGSFKEAKSTKDF